MPGIQLTTISNQNELFNGDASNNDILNNISGFWEANSESESESSQEDGGGEEKKDKITFRKLKRKIHRQYDMNIVHKYSTALDVFVRYIQCYHILYSEASYHCNYKLNMFMLPCMFLSTSCSVMTNFKFTTIKATVLLSIMNGVITFLLAIINYLKLDANAEAHKISAYQYSKLKAQIEFSSGEILLSDNDPYLSDSFHLSDQMDTWIKHNHHIYDSGQADKYDKDKSIKYTEFASIKAQKEKAFIEKVETIMIGIKETLKNIDDNNHFALPQRIVDKYSTIYNMNIFLYIKSIDAYKNVLLNELRNVKNEIRYYATHHKLQSNQIKEKCIKLYQKKNDILRDFFELNKGYTLIDSMLQQELINIELRSKYWVLFYLQNFIRCFQSMCCPTKPLIDVLPRGYHKCTKIGYMDEYGDYLLDKVLRP
jgi:hypothetical protein